MTDPLPRLAVIGGTGALGGALARRWAAAGYPVILGSRSAEKALRSAGEIAAAKGTPPVAGMTNAAAAEAGDIVVIAVPFASHAAILTDIKEVVAGKVVVDATVPLVPPEVGTVQLPPGGSVARASQEYLGAGVDVVSAFHSVAAHKLNEGGAVECDVLVCGDKAAARAAVIGLVEALGLRGLHAGPIANSVAAEALTPILIGINRRYKVDGAGIRITGEIENQGAGKA